MVSIDPGAGPFTITTELLYQSIAYRWAQNLSRFDALEPERFMAYYETVPNLPYLVSKSSLTVDR
jgi:hypothetical protein